MKKFELDLKGHYNFNLTYFGTEYTKKELKGEDFLKLFGALACFCEENADILEEYGLTMSDVVSGAAIQDNELYLNGFEGYDISDRLNLHTLYIDSHDCIRYSVYDNKFDRFIDFVS